MVNCALFSSAVSAIPNNEAEIESLDGTICNVGKVKQTNKVQNVTNDILIHRNACLRQFEILGTCELLRISFYSPFPTHIDNQWLGHITIYSWHIGQGQSFSTKIVIHNS